MSIHTKLRSSGLIAVTAVASVLAGFSPAIAAPLNLPKAPLFLNAAVDPNVIVTLDDSGSMAEAFMPDSVDDNCSYRHPRFYYHGFNRLAFNPNVRYTPPLNPDGTPFPNSTFGAAWFDGYEGQPTTTVTGAAGSAVANLGTQYFPNTNFPARSASGLGTRVGHGSGLAANFNCANPGGGNANTGGDEANPATNVVMTLADTTGGDVTITGSGTLVASANGIGVTGGGGNDQINAGESITLDFMAANRLPAGAQRIQVDFNNTAGTDPSVVTIYGADGTTLINTITYGDTPDLSLGETNVGRVVITAGTGSNLNLRRITRYREEFSMYLPFASSSFVGLNASPTSFVTAAFYAEPDAAQASGYRWVQVSNAQQANFANWFSYYRTRFLMARTSLTRVFGVQDENLRVGWQNLDPNNQDANTVRGPALRFRAGTDPMVKFSGTGRTNYFQWLYRSPASGATPNRAAMLRVASAYRYGSAAIDDLTNPYYEPAPLDRELTCRQNFHIHVTDGFTNETTNPAIPVAVTARPATAMTLPDANAYTPSSQPASTIFWNAATPPTDGCGTGNACVPSLADIAFAHWATDLRADLTNNVPTYVPDRTRGVTTTPSGAMPADPLADPEVYWNPANDPASWQHMVNFTVGLGVAGVRSFPTDYVSLRDGTLAWPGLTNNAPPGVDDLWRAGVVSRGGYFSANNPEELVDSLSATLNSVVVRRGTASAATVTSGIIQASTLAFRTGFDSGDWSGEVSAFELDENGLAVVPAEWEAGAVLTARDLVGDPRQILTSSAADGGGIPFRWDSLPTAYQDALNDDPATSVVDSDGLGERRVEYIRGSRDYEIDQGGAFRIRTNLLGAVVNSGAVVVAAPSAGYTDTNFPVGSPERDAADADPDAKYAKFRSDFKLRRRQIYVGGNDGMLHVFDAGSGVTSFDAGGNAISDLGTGEERWAYVPRELAPTLSALTNPTFEFTPYVDTTPVVRDVFIGDRWRTLLVGGLRRGGQGIYALDVTNPTVTESDAANVVLWEFSDDHPSEASAVQLGYTFGRPNVSRLALNFGGDAGRWVVVVPGAYNNEIPDGAAGDGSSSLFVLDAQTGTLIREFNLPGSVGLTSPTMGDYDDDFIDEFAVAGDLNGNLWRFDLSDASAANWSVTKIFQPATDFEQPITSAPRLFADPATGGLLALFGTGKYLEPIDRTNIGVPTQSLYAIREQGSTKSRTDLVEQTLTKTTVGTTSFFEVTSNDVPSSAGGWYIDFLDQGERDVSSAGALFSLGLAIVATIIPNGDDPCLPGLRGNVYILNAATGSSGQLGPMFDTNADGTIGSGDSTTAVGRSVDSTVSEGSPAVLGIAGGGIGTLIDFPGIQIPQTVWRRRSWRDITPED